jgi:PAS domain S-box-containing protein
MRAERSLKQQLTAVEAAIDGIAILDAEGRYVYVNQSHVCLFGYQEPRELLGQTWRDLYYPDEVERFARDIFPLLLRKGHWQGEATARRRNGSTFAEEVSLTLIEGGGLVCVCRDITERKQAEEQLRSSLQEKELLLKEIHHRVKNNLLVVSSLLDWQTDYIHEPATVKIFEESQQRIHSMALIHEKLYQSQNLAKINFSEYLQTLAEQLFFSFKLDRDRIELKFELEPVLLNIETATPCGLIVSELIANVFEHAFPDNRKGQLCLRLQKHQHQVMVTIRDNGVGFTPDFDFRQTETLGLQLVCLLTHQLEGDLKVVENNGISFQLIFSELHYRQRI